METEIILITSCCGADGQEQIYGLGKDQKIYYWSYLTGKWALNKRKEEI